MQWRIFLQKRDPGALLLDANRACKHGTPSNIPAELPMVGWILSDPSGEDSVNSAASTAREKPCIRIEHEQAMQAGGLDLHDLHYCRTGNSPSAHTCGHNWVGDPLRLTDGGGKSISLVLGWCLCVYKPKIDSDCPQDWS